MSTEITIESVNGTEVVVSDPQPATTVEVLVVLGLDQVSGLVAASIVTYLQGLTGHAAGKVLQSTGAGFQWIDLPVQ